MSISLRQQLESLEVDEKEKEEENKGRGEMKKMKKI